MFTLTESVKYENIVYLFIFFFYYAIIINSSSKALLY